MRIKDLDDDDRIVLASYEPQGEFQILARLISLNDKPPHILQVLGETENEQMYFREFKGKNQIDFQRYSSRQWKAWLQYCAEDADEDEIDLPLVEDLASVVASVKDKSSKTPEYFLFINLFFDIIHFSNRSKR
eukprot:gb/GECH01008728.1/.p1 GENE.gb/GECH01008728.1/~~gb/GECH01008728.1/.p1  ORF type:complete len:133 (+),score=23.36 gb/GECH01008728.1/:1-399(+)